MFNLIRQVFCNFSIIKTSCSFYSLTIAQPVKSSYNMFSYWYLLSYVNIYSFNYIYPKKEYLNTISIVNSNIEQLIIMFYFTKVFIPSLLNTLSVLKGIFITFAKIPIHKLILQQYNHLNLRHLNIYSNISIRYI